MANSSIVKKVKNKVIKELIKDSNIVSAINSDKVSKDTPEKLINTHIFNYHQNPYTIDTVSTFITIQVHIPDSYIRNRTFVNPQLEIWIISHERHMTVDNIPKITENRNDYLSELIDEKFNGRSDFGFGDMKLVSNIEGAFQTDYLYRKMIFEGTDLNMSMCTDEE